MQRSLAVWSAESLCSNRLESAENGYFQLNHLSFILPVPYLNLILADIKYMSYFGYLYTCSLLDWEAGN